MIVVPYKINVIVDNRARIMFTMLLCFTFRIIGYDHMHEGLDESVS